MTKHVFHQRTVGHNYTHTKIKKHESKIYDLEPGLGGVLHKFENEVVRKGGAVECLQ